MYLLINFFFQTQEPNLSEGNPSIMMIANELELSYQQVQGRLKSPNRIRDPRALEAWLPEARKKASLFSDIPAM